MKFKCMIVLFIFFNNTCELDLNFVSAINSFLADQNEIAPYQIICHIKHNKSNDVRYFAEAKFDNKQDAIEIYKDLHPSYATDTYETELLSYNSNYVKNFSFLTDQLDSEIICKLRSSNKDQYNKIEIPFSYYFDFNPAREYNKIVGYFPTIFGYHPRGGAMIYTHAFFTQFSYPSNGLKTFNWKIFETRQNNNFQKTKQFYLMELSRGLVDNTSNYIQSKSLWGSLFRHDFNNYIKSNDYYTFPMMKTNINPFEIFEFSSTFNDKSKLPEITKFFSDSTDLYSFVKCSSLDNMIPKYLVLRRNTLCKISENTLSFTLTCSYDKSSFNPTYRVLTFEGYCIENDNSEWMYFYE